MKRLSAKSLVLVIGLLAFSTNVYATPTCTREANGVIDPTKDCTTAAVCDGSTNDGPVFLAAMTTLNNPNLPGGPGGTLLVPARTCMCNSTLSINQNNISIACAGQDFSCTLQTSIASLPQINSNNLWPGVNNISVKGIRLIHTVPATSGGDGIDFFGWVDHATIDTVDVEYGWNNLDLSACSISRVQNSWTLNATNNNIQLQANSGTMGNQIQWDLQSVGVGGAGNYGIYVLGSGGPPQYQNTGLILGDWHNVQTYINTNGSVAVIGTTLNGTPYPVNDLRIDKGWFCCSHQGSYEVYLLMQNGINNRIEDSIIELAPEYGLAIDGTTTDLTLSGIKVSASGYSGILDYGQHVILAGSVLENNGTVPGAPHKDGIDVFGGSIVISGLLSHENKGYGLNMSVDSVYWSGGDAMSNTVGVVNGLPPVSNSKVCAVNGISSHCQ